MMNLSSGVFPLKLATHVRSIARASNVLITPLTFLGAYGNSVIETTINMDYTGPIEYIDSSFGLTDRFRHGNGSLKSLTVHKY